VVYYLYLVDRVLLILLYWQRTKFWNWTFLEACHQLASSFCLIQINYLIWCLLYGTIIIIVIANIRLVTTVKATLQAFDSWFLNLKLLRLCSALKEDLLLHMLFGSPPRRLPTLSTLSALNLCIKMNRWHYFTHNTILIGMSAKCSILPCLWALSLHRQLQIMGLRRFRMLKCSLYVATNFLIGDHLPIWIALISSCGEMGTFVLNWVRIILVISKLNFYFAAFVSPFVIFIHFNVVNVLFIILNYLRCSFSSNLFHL